MFERSEFLPLLKTAVKWRDPANGGQGGRAPFSAYSVNLGTCTRYVYPDLQSMATSGDATPRPLWLLTRYLGTRNQYMSPDNYLEQLQLRLRHTGWGVQNKINNLTNSANNQEIPISD